MAISLIQTPERVRWYFEETGQIPIHLCDRHFLQEVLDSTQDNDEPFVTILRKTLAGLDSK